MTSTNRLSRERPMRPEGLAAERASEPAEVRTEPATPEVKPSDPLPRRFGPAGAPKPSGSGLGAIFAGFQRPAIAAVVLAASGVAAFAPSVARAETPRGVDPTEVSIPTEVDPSRAPPSGSAASPATATPPASDAPPATVTPTPPSDPATTVAATPPPVEPTPPVAPRSGVRFISPLTPELGTVPPLSPSLLREPLRLSLADPRVDANAHAEMYALVPGVIGFAADRFAERYPIMNRNFGLRLLEYSATLGAEVPWMVLSHEFGHYRVADGAGWSPQVELTGWMSGVTRYTVPAGSDPDGRIDIMAGAAGVNQQELNSTYLFRRWSRNGATRYQEAMAYMLAQTNLSLYTGRSLTRGDGAPSWDDIDGYVRTMNARGHDFTKGHLMAMSTAADLLSAPFWASLIGQVQFLANGDRVVEMPMLSLGPVETTLPHGHVYLTTEGPVIGGNILVNPRGTVPVELTVDVRYDRSAFAVGAQAFDVPLGTDRLLMNPFIRLTHDDRLGLGARLGADFTARVHDRVSVTGTVSYQARDLLAEPLGNRDGVAVNLSLGLHL